jgi:hypothetical protein
MMATAVQSPGFTFCEETHTYKTADGIIVPSATQILKSEGFINFDGIPHAILERKRRLGTLVHQATHLWENGEDLNQFDIPEAAWPYIKGYINFCNDTGFQPDLVEKRMLANVHGMCYGMTPDRRGDLHGIRTILELKCGVSESPVWGLQLAYYDVGVNNTKGRPCDARAALQLGPQFPPGYKLFPYEDPVDYHVAMNALADVIWKQNKKLFQNEDVPERLY